MANKVIQPPLANTETQTRRDYAAQSPPLDQLAFLDNRAYPAHPQPPEIKPAFLDKPGAAQFLGVSVRCLEVWMKKQLVPYSRISRTVRFYPEDLTNHVRSKLRVV